MAKRKQTARQEAVPPLSADATEQELKEYFESFVRPRYQPAVYAVARQFVRSARARLWAVEEDDALQWADLALWIAFLRDRSCGPGFTSLAKMITKRKLTNWIKREVPIIRGVGGGDGGPPAQVYSLDGLREREPESWEGMVRPLDSLYHGQWMMPQSEKPSGRRKKAQAAP